ncbi:MAG: hypothetical protein RR993_02900, partial [Clostridia bacterium]
VGFSHSSSHFQAQSSVVREVSEKLCRRIVRPSLAYRETFTDQSKTSLRISFVRDVKGRLTLACRSRSRIIYSKKVSFGSVGWLFIISSRPFYMLKFLSKYNVQKQDNL